MTSPPPSERILIVDDEDQIRTLLARLLGAQGYDCLTAESAAAGRRALEASPIALVLCDVNMPGESGLDFTGEVLTHYPDTAVVMVTGMDDRRFAQVAIDLGAYGYILKPFKPNELIINVGNALCRRVLEIENRGHRERLEQTVLERTSALPTRSSSSRRPTWSCGASARRRSAGSRGRPSFATRRRASTSSA